MRGSLQTSHAFDRTSAWASVRELSPEPRYAAYTDLGVLLCEVGTRDEAVLEVFEEALNHFQKVGQLHFNRAVVLEDLGHVDDATASYRNCLHLDPRHADAHFDFTRLGELRGDPKIALRHISAYRKLAD